MNRPDHTILGTVKATKLEQSDTELPLVCFQAADISRDNLAPNALLQLKIEPTGSDTDNYLKITVRVGESTTTGEYTDYIFSPSATETAGTDEDVTIVTTLGAFIKALNEKNIGVWAYRLNGPYDLSLANDDFAAFNAGAFYDIPKPGAARLETLYRDVSELTGGFSGRVGVVHGSSRHRIKLIGVDGIATAGSGSPTITISSDPGPTEANEQVLLKKTFSSATQTELYDFHEKPVVFDGPLLVEVTGTTITAGLVVVRWANADV